MLDDTEIAARIREARRCLLCREDRRPAGNLCWTHHDELGRMLDPDYVGERDLDRAASIPQLYARLDPTPAATGDDGRRAPGFASQPPCNLDPIVMRDERSLAYPVVDVWYDPHPSGVGDDYARPHHEDETPARAVHKAITGVADMLWEDLGYHGPHIRRDVAHWCGWLHTHLDDITARDDADEIWRDIADLHSQLRPAAGDPKPQPVAHCTGWIQDRVTRERVECEAPLYLPPADPGVESGPADPPKLDPKKPVLRCRRCDRPYTYLMLLRAEIGEQRQAC